MNKLQNEIIGLLTEDARLTPERIAVMLGRDKKLVADTVEQMEKSGIILKYTAVVNEELMEKNSVQALIEVKVSPMYTKGFDQIAEDICRFDEVKSLYLMSGGFDLAIIIEGKTLKEVAMFVSEKLSLMDKVISTATHFILKKYKAEGVPMGEAGEIKRISVQP